MTNVDGTSVELSGLAAIDANCAEHSGCYRSLFVTDKENCIKQNLEYITMRILVGISRRFVGTLRHVLEGQNPRLRRGASLKNSSCLVWIRKPTRCHFLYSLFLF